MGEEMLDVTLSDFYDKLSERVSGYNARLLLQSVIIDKRLEDHKNTLLDREEAKNICLELIKKGGPAFQVGRDMYNKIG